MSVASITHVKEVLNRLDLSAKKKYGQNFLIDANITDRIASLACQKDTVVLEIGPGMGALSEQLLKYAKAVYAYEIDHDMVEILKQDFPSLIVYEEDFLKTDLSLTPFYKEKLCVASNLPYYVTTPILFKLFESQLDISKITVMVQKEVADRFKAKKGEEDYNALSVIVNYLYDVKLQMQVPRAVFYPKPNVDSAVLTFLPKRERDREYEKKLFPLIKASFVQRRKTLFNNLKDIYGKERVLEMFSILSLKDTIRAQELGIEDFMRICEVLNETESL